jgi:anti-anti-sigma regulatory factor
MNDLTILERRLALAEELLNILDAMRPDLPAAELHELGLQMLSGIGDYRAGSLWIYGDSRYRSAAWYGMDPQRASAIRGAILDELLFQHFLSQLEARGGMHWQRWPLPPDAPEPLQSPPGEGHTLIVPLAFMTSIGFVALESPAPAPDDDALATLARFGDKIAVALDTARLFQQHLQTIDELHRLTQEQRQLQATVIELSAPLLPLLPGVLVLPLIGAIDSQRAKRILEAELEAIIREQAQVVLVDITGTSVVDTDVAMQLIRSAEAARLLGCRTILVGIQPEIAQTLVGLGVHLRGIATRSTLAGGLQEALLVVRRRIVMLDDQRFASGD